MINQLEKHKKAVLILEAIDTATNRIFRKEDDLKKYGENDFLGWSQWQIKNIESLKKAKLKLQNYYNQNFQI